MNEPDSPLDENLPDSNPESEDDWLDELTPRQIVAELDRYIVGQEGAKKAVAIALRNRWRRSRVEPELREEISPNNLILIGPTGVGKTEVARRLARLAGAPFVKVEASKFTEVGYVGRDVESMVRDLADTAVNMVRVEREDEVQEEAEQRAEDHLLDLLLPPVAPDTPGSRATHPPAGREKGASGAGASSNPAPEGGSLPGGVTLGNVFVAGPQGVRRADGPSVASQRPNSDSAEGSQGEPEADGPQPEAQEARPHDPAARRARTREKLRKLLTDGKLEDREVEIEVDQTPSLDGMMLPMGGMEGMDHNFTEMLQDMLPRRKKRRSMRVAEARRILIQTELDRLVDMDEVVGEALARAEEMGIIFLDEIDKVAGDRGGAGPDVSREGVQRDLLPIVEGSNVQTKYGLVRTDHMLFIAAGAFHVSKPSDLIPELQGRFPIRVELRSLEEADFVRILTEPKNALLTQYTALAATENTEIDFTEDGILEVARVAAQLNDRMENIGARRLQTVMTTVLEDVLFNLPEEGQGKLTVDRDFVSRRLENILDDEDLRRFIL